MADLTTDQEQQLRQAGTEIYDAIMREIEMDLVSENLDHLEEMYAGETEEEKQERMERYGKAFAEYDVRFTQYMKDLEAEVHVVRKEAREQAESQERAEEEKVEADLLSQMRNA